MNDNLSIASTDKATVGAVQRVGPTHARGLNRLVGINSNIRQGEPTTDMRLDFELSCDVAPLRIEGSDFDMGLRKCFVTLKRENCAVRIHSAYEHWLGSGAFGDKEIRRVTSEQAREAGAKVRVEFDSTKVLGSLAAMIGLGASRKHDAKTEVVTEQSARIGLVVASGQDRWRVGDPIRGDARTRDGILSGAYFDEERTNEGDPLPLCRLSWNDHVTPIEVTLTVSASFGSLLVFQLDGTQSGETADLKGAQEVLKFWSRRVPSQHEKALRAHVAGLVAAKSIRNAQKKAGADVPENEFIIARQTLLASADQARSHDEGLDQ